MIKSLQKRISTLFMFLLTIIWLVILLLFVNNSYRNNLSDLQQTVRAALHYTHGMHLSSLMDRRLRPNLIIFPIVFFLLMNPMKWISCLTLFLMSPTVIF